MNTTLSPLERLDGVSDIVGHIPEPIRDYLEWVIMVPGQPRDELLRLLDDDLERARAHADALRSALQRVRRYTADTSPASIPQANRSARI